MIAAVGDLFYVRGPRDWPVVVRVLLLVGLVGALGTAVWMVTRGEMVYLIAGIAIGAVAAGGTARFLHALQRLRWYRLDAQQIQDHDGRVLEFMEIDHISVAEEAAGLRVLLLQAPKNDLRIPLLRKGRDMLVHLPLFVALLEERTKRPPGSIARLVRG